MCGRTAMRASFEEACEAFGVPPDRFSGSPSTSCSPSYNVCPGKTTAVFFSSKEGAEGAEQVFARPMAWGLVPGYAKRPEPGKFHDFWRMFNARSESLAESPIFSRLLAQGKRCVVPVSGFYEWKKKLVSKKKKEPYYVFPKSSSSQFLLCAALYDVWSDKETGESLYSYAILTREPHREIAWLHDRQPVLLDGIDGATSWLMEGCQGQGHVPLRWHPVSTKVGNVNFDQPECIEDARQAVLRQHKGSIMDLFAAGRGGAGAGGIRLGEASSKGTLGPRSPVKKAKGKAGKDAKALKSFFL